MKEILSRKISNSLIVLGVLSTYFGYTHNSGEFIPAEIKYATGIIALFLGVLGHFLNFKNSRNIK
jgi:Flp pilus assembly protein protease CpaA